MNKCFFDKTECLEIKDISLHVIVEGEGKLQNCCSKCLFKMQDSFNTENEIPSALDEIENNPEKKCSSCNSTLNEMFKSARVGCPLCYSFFQKELSTLIYYYQKSILHEGKKPKEKYKSVLLHCVLKDLEEKLKTSSEEEKEKILSLIKKLN